MKKNWDRQYRAMIWIREKSQRKQISVDQNLMSAKSALGLMVYQSGIAGLSGGSFAVVRRQA